MDQTNLKLFCKEIIVAFEIFKFVNSYYTRFFDFLFNFKTYVAKNFFGIWGDLNTQLMGLMSNSG